MTDIRFDDLAALQQLVSEEFSEFGPPIHISQAMIDGFAEVTLDPQWIHTDVERAKKESPFGGTIAHGFLVLSLATALQDGSGVRVVGFGSAINYGAEKLRFVSAVPAGSDVHCRRRVCHVRRKGLGSQLTFDVEVYVVAADKPALVYQQLALYLP